MSRIYIKKLKIKYFELKHADKFTKINFGSTREIYVSKTGTKNSIFKLEYNAEWVYHNVEEYVIYKNNYKEYNFLARIKGITKDYRVLEMEKLNTESIETMAKNAKYTIDSIFDLVNNYPGLNNKIDFDWDDVDTFIKKNKLEEEEIYYYKNWALNKEGKLRLVDYSR